MTAGEFMKDLKYVGGTSFHDSITPEFAGAFSRLSEQELTRIRGFLPEIEIKNRPYVRMSDDSATVRINIPNAGPEDTITFHMIRDYGWRVDDYSIDSRGAKIASFRGALPVLASVTAFGEFVKDPAAGEPSQFVLPGGLFNELMHAKAVGRMPVSEDEKRQEILISEDLTTVTCRYPSRTVRMHLVETDGRRLIERVETLAGDQWTDVAQLLAMKRQLSSLSFASALLGKAPAAPPPAVEQPVVVENAVAMETVEQTAQSVVTETVAREPETIVDTGPAEPAKLAEPAPAATEEQTEVAAAVVAPTVEQPVQLVGYNYVPVRYSKRYYRQSRRGWRRCRRW